MKSIIKGSLISVVTCAVLLSLQGCGKDRAGISVDEAALHANSIDNGTQGLDNANCGARTDDRDCDGLTNDDEVNVYGTNPDNKDTDGDTLTDGCEVGITVYANFAECGKSDPRTKHSDTDTLTDDKELLKWHTNPKLNDTDYDGLNDNVEVNTQNTNPNDPDTDHDGLKDGEEVNNKGLDPKNPDWDKDGLSDGYEVKKSSTDPKDIDSDDDGVTDGIEVCGTFDSNGNFPSKTTDGKVEGVLDGISIKEKSNDFYDDILDVTNPIKYNVWKLQNNQAVEVSANDSRCQTPANYNNDNIIDAKDKYNDSDGDERTNTAEKDKTDPLNGGRAPKETALNTRTSADIQDKAYEPWITQTPDGDKMVQAGFIYVPKAKHDGDKYGYWLSKYLAVFTDNNNDKVKFVKEGDKVDNVSTGNAKTLLTDSKSDLNINNNISLPTLENYQDLISVKSSISNDCITVKNTVNDKNMPNGYTNTICEFIPLSDNSINQEFKMNGTVYVKKNASITNDSQESANQNTHFRAATGYMN